MHVVPSLTSVILFNLKGHFLSTRNVETINLRPASYLTASRSFIHGTKFPPIQYLAIDMVKHSRYTPKYSLLTILVRSHQPPKIVKVAAKGVEKLEGKRRTRASVALEERPLTPTAAVETTIMSSEYDHIRRPRNAFLIFRLHFIATLADASKRQQTELSKEAGKAWNRLSVGDKKRFFDIAYAERQQNIGRSVHRGREARVHTRMTRNNVYVRIQNQTFYSQKMSFINILAGIC